MACRHGATGTKFNVIQDIVQDMIMMTGDEKGTRDIGPTNKKALKRLKKNFSKFSKDEVQARAMVIAEMRGLATEELLATDSNADVVKGFCRMSVYLSCGFPGFAGFPNPEAAFAHVYLDMQKVETRQGTVRFLANRIPCDCLKELKKEVKKQVKMGHCKECKGEFPVSDLFYCSRCRLTYYCSRECQLQHWPRHRCGNSATI